MKMETYQRLVVPDITNEKPVNTQNVPKHPLSSEYISLKFRLTYPLRTIHVSTGVPGGFVRERHFVGGILEMSDHPMIRYHSPLVDDGDADAADVTALLPYLKVLLTNLGDKMRKTTGK